MTNASVKRFANLSKACSKPESKSRNFLAEVEDLGEIPADELQQSKLKKASWKQERDLQMASRKEYEECKAKADRELAQIKADIASLLQKRQKFEQKASKYSEQHDRLLSLTSQTQEAQARRAAKRDEELRARGLTERRWIDQTAMMDREAQGYYITGTKALEQCGHLEDLFTKNLQQQSMPTTPEGPLPGTTRTSLLQHHNTFPSSQPGFQFPVLAGGFPEITTYHSNPTSMYREGGRGRSSSMLSGVSGFTDELDDYPLPAYSVVYPAMTNGAHSNRECRKSSAGSGSTSSASGTSSQMDPMSPAPKSLSPVFGNGKSSASPLSPPVSTTNGVR